MSLVNKGCLIAMLGSFAGGASAVDGPFIYPVPRNMACERGCFEVSAGTFQVPDSLPKLVTAKVTDLFQTYAGVDLSEGIGPIHVSFSVDTSLHEQGYSLKISEGGVAVRYRDDAGAVYALATLKQLLVQYGAALPCLTITDDYPDFLHRGYMWDISRNKIPTVDTIKRVIDILADLKYNQLQLYIEGFPFAYASYPEAWKYGTPLTPEDFQEINAYCAERFIEFVPNQNSYGHMNKWLNLPQFDGLKEVPGAANASTLALTCPQTITFLKNLYGDLLPNFTSHCFNIGGDETREVGTGQSQIAYPDLSKEEIYLEGLKTLYGLVKEENKTMMFWADMVVKYADSNPAIIRAAKEAMPDAIPINWGYEFDYDFENSTAKLMQAGFNYYVSVGTATWSSYIGRTSNMTKNLENAAMWGKKNGAAGYLLTSWGDQGHHQNIICDYSPLTYAAGLSWYGAGNSKEQVDYNRYVSRVIFKDVSGNISSRFSELADYNSISPRCWNKSWINSVAAEDGSSDKNLLSFIRFQKCGSEEENRAEALRQAEQVSAMCREFLAYLPTVTLGADDREFVQAELKNSVQILQTAADYAAMRLRIHNGISTPDQEAGKAGGLYREYKSTLSDFKEIWMMRNKLSLRSDTLKNLYHPLKYFKTIAGNPIRPLSDGNHFLMTPDTISFPLASDEIVSGWVWSLSGSGEPVITGSYGVDTATQIRGAIADGVISLLESQPGVSGRVFCYDPVAARQKGCYKIWDHDGKTKLLPRFGWPAIFDGAGEYKIIFKAKFKNGTLLRKNLTMMMSAVQADGGLKGVPLAATACSEPDASGWQTVSQHVAIGDTIKTASFCMIPSGSTADTLYINGLFMKKSKSVEESGIEFY